MTQTPPAELAAVIDRIRRGDLPGARAVADAALTAQPRLHALRALAGIVACQMGDPAAGIGHFRVALNVMPGDRATRINLATALASTQAHGEIIEICGDGHGDPRLLRIAGWAQQQSGRNAEAEAAYRAAVALDPQDYESWNNLGNLRTAAGDAEGAIVALERAINIRPDLPAIYINLAKLLGGLDRPEARLHTMREAAHQAPSDAEVQYELGLALAAMADYPEAEHAFREAILLARGFTPAYLELGLLLENLNRIDALEALLAEAEKRGVAAAEMGLLHAWALRRQGKFAEAMPLAEAVPETISPIRRNQLIAELADRLGDSGRAFAAFEAMNRASLAEAGPTTENYPAEVAAEAARLTPARIAKWTRAKVAHEPPAPVFIVGFPRSGTTLLDTLMMNMPDLHVLEEQPVMRQVEGMIDPDALGTLSAAELDRMRARYFEALEAIAPPPRPGMTVVDKYPLHMARMPLIHRVFPDAKIILVERHPCDAVLSCFMSNFQLNRAMRAFVTLEGAARLYDTVFDCWTRATELLPVDFHRIRYERMVEDLESEMRALLGFLDIAWDDKILDNQSAAAKREHIRTASYSQVTEPIYKRSSGRWERYRAQMAPALPILAPWAERMGYEI
jgi:tetratricopeptide (TPR) repeat protein